MHTHDSLKADLTNMGIQADGTLLVHSSMKAIGAVDGGADTVLNALGDYMASGLLVLPTHTWEQINANNPVYDVTTTESCVGLLTEMFRKRPGVLRSHHPTHSIAALGQDAEAFIAGDAYLQTPCNRFGPWGRLLDRQATILFIGCDLTKNTYMHGVEEWLNIPDNLHSQAEQLFSRDEKGTVIPIPQYRHKGNRSEVFHKVEAILMNNGAMRMGHFGDAQTRVCDVLRMTEILMVMLQRNPALFSDGRPADMRLYPMYAGGQEHLNTSTLDF